MMKILKLGSNLINLYFKCIHWDTEDEEHNLLQLKWSLQVEAGEEVRMLYYHLA